MVVLGTNYAGEMKKGVFTAMNYWMPKSGVLSMHCSANQGTKGDTTLFFGLSGTGKTTLSSDPRRRLIGDDEHCWSDHGIFNIEGGCYAKCLGLTEEQEPQILPGNQVRGRARKRRSRPGVTRCRTTTIDRSPRTPARATRSSTSRRPSFPCVGGHPKNIIFLTCDAFGVLPPVSRLTPSQASYHFLSGYTAKVAGTEVGIAEPQATFSACFGAAFLVLHPTRYGDFLADKIRVHNAQAWLVNTGWTGGPYGVGSRIKLAYTRAIIDAIHDGSLFKCADRARRAPGNCRSPRRARASPTSC